MPSFSRETLHIPCSQLHRRTLLSWHCSVHFTGKPVTLIGPFSLPNKQPIPQRQASTTPVFRSSKKIAPAPCRICVKAQSEASSIRYRFHIPIFLTLLRRFGLGLAFCNILSFPGFVFGTLVSNWPYPPMGKSTSLACNITTCHML